MFYIYWIRCEKQKEMKSELKERKGEKTEVKVDG